MDANQPQGNDISQADIQYALDTGSKLFSPKATGDKVRAGTAPVLGLTRKRVFYAWSDETKDLTERERNRLAVTLIGCARSVEDSVRKWETFVLTLLALAYPDWVSIFVASNCERLSFNKNYIRDLDRAISSAFENQTTEIEDSDGVSPLLPPQGFPSWEDASGTYCPGLELYESTSTETIYSFVSILLFIIGKSFSNEDYKAIHINRPKALINKYHIGTETYYLNGPGKLSKIAISMIARFWVTSITIRKEIVDRCALFEESEEMQLDVVYSTFKLLDFAQFAYVKFIDRLVQDHPWIFSLDYLRASCVYYISCLKEFTKLPAGSRGFMKLKQGDRMTLFNRRTLAPLIACAIKWLERRDPDISGYNKPENMEDVEDRFIIDLTARGYPLPEV